MGPQPDRLNPVFIGHGSPMNAIMKNRYSDFLTDYARMIPKPEAIIVISAHWQTIGTCITASDNPEQIYDFYGFPDDLYKVKYAPAGARGSAELIRDEVPDIRLDERRGIDHAAWAVVKHLYPAQDVPLLEISLDTRKSAREHFDLGQQLGKLRNSGVLFIGSGNMVHNLGDISFDESVSPFKWAVDADMWLKGCLQNNRMDELVEYEKHFPDYQRSIPTNEHYLPLLYILGMHDQQKSVTTLYEEIQNGSISMRSIAVTR